jgi:hypothetical protein
MAERQRADRAEQRAHEEHARADHAEQQVDTLRKELTEARTAERIITSEAADLRCRLDAQIEERRQATDRLATAQERISALLADQRATPPTARTPTRRFWLPWRRHS